jgi:hypothetical protein
MSQFVEILKHVKKLVAKWDKRKRVACQVYLLKVEENTSRLFSHNLVGVFTPYE